MTPILNAIEGSPEAIYTSIHGKTRAVVENTFGRLKNRWRCLSKDRTLHYTPERCAAIIMACSVLHNLAIDFSIPEDIEEPVGQTTDNYDVVLQETVDDSLIQGRVLRNTLVDRINMLQRF